MRFFYKAALGAAFLGLSMLSAVSAAEIPESDDDNIGGFGIAAPAAGDAAPASLFSEEELRAQKLVQPRRQAAAAKTAAAKTAASGNTASGFSAVANNAGMPPTYVSVSAVVYERVPSQASHRRRSMSSRGAMNSSTVARRRNVSVDITPMICRYAAHYKIDPWFVRAVIETESNFYPYAGSPAGAGGLMQLMPATAASLGCRDRFDPESNIAAGCRYLRQMLNMFNNDYTKAIAAYNAGPGAVMRSGGVPPYRETINYVAKVKRLWKQGKAGAEKRAAKAGAR